MSDIYVCTNCNNDTEYAQSGQCPDCGADLETEKNSTLDK